MAERKSFLLRMDPDLWKEIEAWAQQELRSVNGQIEYLLKQAVAKRKSESPPTLSEEP
ncbi:MAG: Arc family DNA binding domain-containing protein [Verrucomicrobia bacterium]|nr:Arc family DNA binding domain-containing protein [Verrucomicrobiota bacterium]